MPLSNYSSTRNNNATIAPGNIRSDDSKRDQQIINAIRQLMADLADAISPFALTFLDDADAATFRATTGTNDASNQTQGTLPDGRFPATLPTLDGSNLTSVDADTLDGHDSSFFENASNLSAGTVPDARFPATLPAASGENLTDLNASNASTGTLADARLSSNVPLLDVANTFSENQEVSSFSGTGASAGVVIAASALVATSKDVTSSAQHHRFVNPNGTVGSTVTDGMSTSFNESSDGRTKQDHEDFDPGAIIDAIEVTKHARTDGSKRHGPRAAQQLYDVFPEAVTPGQGEPGDPDFIPWMWDASKLVPVLVRDNQSLRSQVADLKTRIVALENRSS